MANGERDRYGLPLGTASAGAAAAYGAALDRMLSGDAGVADGFAAAAEADEGFALAHAGLALAWHSARRPDRARPALARAEALTGGLGRRERGHVAAIGAAVRGDGARAGALLRAQLADFPRDALALTVLVGLVRNGGRADWPDQSAALLDGFAPAYGEDWWFLGARSFAQHELRRFDAARRLGERSLALYPRNAIPVHSLAHVHYETADHAAGHAFLGEWIADYHRQAGLHGHLWWHMALFDLATGRPERAIATYERSLRPEVADGREALPDAASFLWRWLIYGLAERELPWGPVRDLAGRLTAQPGAAFLDAHAALAYAGAGDADALARLIDGIGRLAAGGNAVAGEVVLPLARGIAAFAEGDYARTIALIAPIAPQIVRIGGSHAQREVFEDTLIQAYLRAGRTAEATAALTRRLEHRHSARDAAWLQQAAVDKPVD